MKYLSSVVFLLLFFLLSIQSCKDACDNTLCQNGGTCIEGSCDCLDGFSGDNCEIQDLCSDIICQNNGTCIDGTCECPEGVIGTNCELYDPAKVQILLNNGKTPFDLYEGGILLDSLYGKMYKNGLIFYLNTTNGTGIVAATTDLDDDSSWGCWDTDITDLNNINLCPGPGTSIANCFQPLNEETEEGARIGDGLENTNKIIAGCIKDHIAAKFCRLLGSEWFLPSRGELNLMFVNLKTKGLGGFADKFYLCSTERTNDRTWMIHFEDGFLIDVSKFANLPVRAARTF